MSKVPFTRQQVQQEFADNGLSISDWARVRGFRRELVYAVLNGRSIGRRGQSHEIAVALGLKIPGKRALTALENSEGDGAAPRSATAAGISQPCEEGSPMR